MRIKTHILYIVTIIVLVLLLFKPFTKSDEVKVFGDSLTDTLSFRSDTNIIEIFDTLKQDSDSAKIEYKEKIVKDTIYIRDTVTKIAYPTQIVQKYFSEPNRYDLWISGVEPLNLDKINVYNEIKYKTITNTITTEVIPPPKNELYFGGGFCKVLTTFTPIMGVSLKTKRNTLYSLDFGYYKGNSLILGTAKVKLGKNK